MGLTDDTVVTGLPANMGRAPDTKPWQAGTHSIVLDKKLGSPGLTLPHVSTEPRW